MALPTHTWIYSHVNNAVLYVKMPITTMDCTNSYSVVSHTPLSFFVQFVIVVIYCSHVHFLLYWSQWASRVSFDSLKWPEVSLA